MDWIRAVVAIGRPSEAGTRSLAKVMKNSCAARATPMYSPMTVKPAKPAPQRGVCDRGRPGKVVGLDRDVSRELLSIVHDQYRKPEFQVRFSWRPGSIAFWDNRAAVHYAVRNYGDYPRLLERILIADDPQYADL